MVSLKNILDLSVELGIRKIFWPSSIAVFGPDAKKDGTPQDSALNPTTMYGVTKVAGELLCNYYHKKYGLDVRSLRFPGIISWKTSPNGGTTDYAVNIFYEALSSGEYICFVSKDTILPMMYMEDAIDAILLLTSVDAENLSIRTSYNLAAMSFSAEELVEGVKKELPNFRCRYAPDERQKIADSWPNAIDDSIAKRDWGWKPTFDLNKTINEMFKRLKVKMGVQNV